MQYRSAFAQGFELEASIAGAIFFLVAACLLTAVIVSRRRRRRSQPSSQRANNNKAELIYLGVVAVIAVFLIVVSLTLNGRERAMADPARGQLVVKVTGYQWCWKFQYPGQGVTVTGKCDGQQSPTLVLPAHRTVRVEVTSSDVIHGFWVPYLRWKIYAYPGHINTFTVTLGQNGKWVGRCSEYCGLYHYEMDFYLQAVSPSQFTKWLHAHRGTPAAVNR